MSVPSRRGRSVAIFGLVISLVFFAVTWVTAMASRSTATLAISYQILGGGLICLVLCIQMHQRALAEQEKLDMAQLAREKSAGTIFQGNEGRADIFAVAQKRLELLEKWFVPIFSVVIALYQVLMGLYLIKRANTDSLSYLRLMPIGAVVLVIVAFVTFLISRYMTGMSQDETYKPLKASGSSLLATSVFSFAVAVCLSLAQFKILTGVKVMMWVVPIILTLLGVETALNLILDFYRPRIKGQYSRSAFDSRLLGIINEPGGIFHTFAATIDYQFGFKVSQTWFYRILEKAILPLVMFCVIILYLFSCFVVVSPGERAVIEHLGSADPAKGSREVGPGLHFKLPSPFERAYKHSTELIQKVNIGFVEDDDHDNTEPRLWGKQHYAQEYDLLVAAGTSTLEEEKGTVPVSIVRAAVPVQYRVRNLHDYIYNHSDSAKMLETICYKELTNFAASAKIETEYDEDPQQARKSLLGAGRDLAAKELIQRIQTQADQLGLGVEIVFLGMQGIHPNPEVTEDYQKVVGTVQKKQAAILDAMAQKNDTLASLSGSVENAEMLYEISVEYQNAKAAGDLELINKTSAKLEQAFQQAKGDIYKTMTEANSAAFETVTVARAAGQRFQNQILAHQASPQIYKKQLRLAMLEEALKDVRKYVVISEDDDSQVYVIDLQEKLAPSLYDLEFDELEQN